MIEQRAHPGRTITVRDVLCYPFVLRSQSIISDSGAWYRLVSYPELGCEVARESLEEALEQLEADKFRTIQKRLPLIEFVLERDPVPDPSLEQQLERLGVTDLIAHLDDELQTYLSAHPHGD
jgi:hypothetical protein